MTARVRRKCPRLMRGATGRCGPRLARHIVLNPQQVHVAKRSCRIYRHLRNVVENRAPRIRPDPELVGNWKKASRAGARNPRPKDGNATNCPPETGARQPNVRECRRFPAMGKIHPRDRTVWLGREDSNLRMVKLRCLTASNPLKPLSRRKFRFPRRGNARSSPRLFEAV
jgi:hypothetical protein